MSALTELLIEIRKLPGFRELRDKIMRSGFFSRGWGLKYASEEGALNPIGISNIALGTDSMIVLLLQQRTEEYPDGDPERVRMIEFRAVGSRTTLLGNEICVILDKEGFVFDAENGTFTKKGG